MKWLNKIWPWSVICNLEQKLNSATEGERCARKAHELTLASTERFIASSQSYRDMVSRFQSFCEQAIPADIWNALIAGYIRRQAPRLTRVRRAFAESGFVPREYPYNFDPVESESVAMKAAWDDLRAKWQAVDKETGK